MWHILRKLNRTVARNVTKERAEQLAFHLGGEIINRHEHGFDKNVLGYVKNQKTIYSYAQIHVEADGSHICSVTRKEDAFRIMQALKRDYKEILCYITA